MIKLSELKVLIASTFTTNGIRAITASSVRTYENTLIDKLNVPAGFIMIYPGDETLLNGTDWRKCDGSSYWSITDFNDLFLALGGYSSPYGVNVGTGTFTIPNIQPGQFVAQAANGDPHTYQLGASGGESTHSLTLDELPDHNHKFSYVTKGTTKPQSGSDTQVWVGTQNIDSVTGYVNGRYTSQTNPPHNNVPPFIALHYIIKIR